MYFMGPLHPSAKQNGTRIYCKKCEKETAFFRRKCLECGTAYMRFGRGGRQATWSDGLRAGRIGKQLGADKAAYWRRMAEESRKKWEGK